MGQFKDLKIPGSSLVLRWRDDVGGLRVSNPRGGWRAAGGRPGSVSFSWSVRQGYEYRLERLEAVGNSGTRRLTGGNHFSRSSGQVTWSQIPPQTMVVQALYVGSNPSGQPNYAWITWLYVD